MIRQRSAFSDVIGRLHASLWLVGGPSGAGKTVVARRLALIRPARLIHLDNYFVSASEVKVMRSRRYGVVPQWDDPESVDLALACQNVKELFVRGSTVTPRYSFFENRRVGWRTVRRSAAESVVVEGVHAILLGARPMLSVETVRVFVNAAPDIRASRMRERDSALRGRPLCDFARRLHVIKVAERRWIYPQLKIADVVVDTSDGTLRIVGGVAVS